MKDIILSLTKSSTLNLKEYIKFYFNQNKIFNILILILIPLALIFTTTISIISFQKIYIFSFVIILLVALLFFMINLFLPIKHKKIVENNKIRTFINFYSDHFLIMTEQYIPNENSSHLEIKYNEIDRLIETKDAFYIYYHKAAFIIAKVDLNKEVINLMHEGWRLKHEKNI
jgi:glucan phosphoethanolaminetransferase (alkaline phosphatase superfamily)